MNITIIAWYLAPPLLLLDAALAGFILGKLCQRRRPVQVPPGPCASTMLGITFTSRPKPVFFCKLRAGHAGLHESHDGSSWGDEASAASRDQLVAQ